MDALAPRLPELFLVPEPDLDARRLAPGGHAVDLRRRPRDPRVVLARPGEQRLVQLCTDRFMLGFRPEVDEFVGVVLEVEQEGPEALGEDVFLAPVIDHQEPGIGLVELELGA